MSPPADSRPSLIPITEQIAEVEREIDMRRAVYHRRVRSGEMKHDEAVRLTLRMEAVRRTLLLVERYQDEIRELTKKVRK